MAILRRSLLKLTVLRAKQVEDAWGSQLAPFQSIFPLRSFASHAQKPDL
jgi:hypothetical protein